MRPPRRLRYDVDPDDGKLQQWDPGPGHVRRPGDRGVPAAGRHRRPPLVPRSVGRRRRVSHFRCYVLLNTMQGL